MFYPHVIRLRGPWQREVRVRFDRQGTPLARVSSESRRVRLPDDWRDDLGPGFRGRVRYTRHFHRPSGLEPYERVWLICEGADRRTTWTLNGLPLHSLQGNSALLEVEITTRLERRNELCIDVELPPPPDAGKDPPHPEAAPLTAGVIREVRLEIRAGPVRRNLAGAAEK